MINAKNIVVFILDFDKYLLTWNGVGTSVVNDKISIERSESPESGFKEIGVVGDDVELYLDEDPQTHRKYIPYYYRLKHSDNTYSAVVHLPFQQDRYLMHFVYLTKRYLKRDIGLRCYYFHFMRSGYKCDCWSEELKTSTVTNCPNCDGTGRILGYADPIEVYISFPPDSPAEINTGHTIYQILIPQAWTSNYPLLFPEDIIIRFDDKEVFKIQGEVRRTGRKLYPSRQLFNTTAIEHGSVEHKLIDRMPSA